MANKCSCAFFMYLISVQTVQRMREILWNIWPCILNVGDTTPSSKLALETKANLCQRKIWDQTLSHYFHPSSYVSPFSHHFPASSCLPFSLFLHLFSPTSLLSLVCLLSSPIFCPSPDSCPSFHLLPLAVLTPFSLLSNLLLIYQVAPPPQPSTPSHSYLPGSLPLRLPSSLLLPSFS